MQAKGLTISASWYVTQRPEFPRAYSFVRGVNIEAVREFFDDRNEKLRISLASHSSMALCFGVEPPMSGSAFYPSPICLTFKSESRTSSLFLPIAEKG